MVNFPSAILSREHPQQNSGNGGDDISAAQQAYRLASQHEYYVANQSRDPEEHKRAHQATKDAMDAMHKAMKAKASSQ